MRTTFNHAANNSPRSGSSKRSAPLVWGMVVTAIVVVTLWLTFHGRIGGVQ